MKKLLTFGIVLCLFLVFNNSHAALVTNTNDDYTWLYDGVVFDTTNELYWYQNLSDFTSKTYDEQINTISGLNSSGSAFNFDDIGDWAMADYNEMDSLWQYTGNEIASAFIPSNTNNTVEYYVGRFDLESASTTDSHQFLLINYYSNINYVYEKYALGDTHSVFDSNSDAYLGAWVVASAQPVPEPTTMLLFGTGIAGLAGYRRKKK